MVSDKVGVSSPVHDRPIAIGDRSLDRALANHAAKAAANGSSCAVIQSRAELLQHEYKKVIENHPGTIASMKGGSSKYDDTDLLSRMFQKEAGDPMIEPLGLNRCDSSSEVLHKSHSMKMLGEATTSSNKQPAAAGVAATTTSQSSVALRMLAGKHLSILSSHAGQQSSSEKPVDLSAEAHK